MTGVQTCALPICTQRQRRQTNAKKTHRNQKRLYRTPRNLAKNKTQRKRLRQKILSILRKLRQKTRLQLNHILHRQSCCNRHMPQTRIQRRLPKNGELARLLPQPKRQINPLQIYRLTAHFCPNLKNVIHKRYNRVPKYHSKGLNHER